MILIFVALPLLFISYLADSWATAYFRDVGHCAAAVQLCFSIPILYFGAFLSGLRPGRWYGTQFLPLFAGILLYVVLQVVDGELLTGSSWYWSPMLFAGPVVAIAFVESILHVCRTRDFS